MNISNKKSLINVSLVRIIWERNTFYQVEWIFSHRKLNQSHTGLSMSCSSEQIDVVFDSKCLNLCVPLKPITTELDFNGLWDRRRKNAALTETFLCQTNKINKLTFSITKHLSQLFRFIITFAIYYPFNGWDLY